MSKILDATCSAVGVVTSEGVPVPAAEVLSEGKQQSVGLLFLEAEKARYLTSNATDIKALINKMITALGSVTDALDQIATTLTAIGTGMTGPTTAPPGSLVAGVSTINSKSSEISDLIDELTTLKGALK